MALAPPQPASDEQQQRRRGDHACATRRRAAPDAPGAQHVDQRRDQRRRRSRSARRTSAAAASPSMPVSSADVHEPGHDQPREVERLALAGVQPAGLVRGVQRARDQAGGDEHEHEPGDPEEARQVEPHAAAVDPRRRSRPRTRGRAARRAPAVSGSSAFWNTASRNTTVSRPSRMTAKNAIATSARAEPLASAPRALVAQLRRTAPRAWRRIHTIMKVTIPIAATPMTVSRPSCWRCGSSSSSSSQQPTPTATQMRDGRGDADPHRAQRVAPPLLAQEAGDDADDQRGLDPFAEADHEAGQHGLGDPNAHSDLRDRN